MKHGLSHSDWAFLIPAFFTTRLVCAITVNLKATELKTAAKIHGGTP